MRCGISTACFYPQETLESLKVIASAGVRVTEIFLNTFSELEDIYIARLLDVVKEHGMEVSSVHPFTSALDGFFFASHYPSRFNDGAQLYRRYFTAAHAFGADKLVFHGDNAAMADKFDCERYAENFRHLSEIGHEFGVMLCHENVSYCRLKDARAVQVLRPLFGKAAAFVLDTKQARRAAEPVEDILKAMSGAVQTVHISDYDANSACVAPGAGKFDFSGFFTKLRRQRYDGDIIIELYRDGFESVSDLLASMNYLSTFMGQENLVKC